jgi:hypothetical protein
VVLRFQSRLHIILGFCYSRSKLVLPLCVAARAGIFVAGICCVDTQQCRRAIAIRRSILYIPEANNKEARILLVPHEEM